MKHPFMARPFQDFPGNFLAVSGLVSVLLCRLRRRAPDQSGSTKILVSRGFGFLQKADRAWRQHKGEAWTITMTNVVRL